MHTSGRTATAPPPRSARTRRTVGRRTTFRCVHCGRDVAVGLWTSEAIAAAAHAKDGTCECVHDLRRPIWRRVPGRAESQVVAMQCARCGHLAVRS